VWLKGEFGVWLNGESVGSLSLAFGYAPFGLKMTKWQKVSKISQNPRAKSLPHPFGQQRAAFS
jgi:hypothetical protein